MKKTLLSVLLGMTLAQYAVAAPTAAAPTSAKLSSNFSSMADQTSYGLGLMLGKNMKKENMNISSAQFMKGFEAGFAGSKALLSDAELHATMLNFRKNMLAKVAAKQMKAAQSNEDAGQKFLEQNKTKTGIVSLPDGLQYKVIKAGEGNSPTKTDTIKVDYRASTIDGKVFDSSYKRGKPAVFKVSGLIRGFQEALLLMKTGATWEIYIPANLAYGQRGVPGVIGPNETLIFKVHLIDVESKPAS